MKYAALFLTAIFFLIFSSKVHASVSNYVRASAKGDGASVNVRINNNLNTGSDYSSFSSKTQAKVNISQTGEGTSSVRINDKEWKLEGPGEINVDQGQDSSPTSTPIPSLTPTPEPTQEPTPTFPHEETSNDSLEPDEDLPMSYSQLLKKRIELIRKSIQKLLNNIFN